MEIILFVPPLLVWFPFVTATKPFVVPARWNAHHLKPRQHDRHQFPQEKFESPNIISREKHAVAPVLHLRGGAAGVLGSPITHEGLAKFMAAYFVVFGTLIAADCGKFFKPFGIKIRPGTLAAFAGEHAGWACLGVAKLACLVLFSDLDVVKSAALSTIPCTFFWIKATYSGAADSFKFPRIVGPAFIVFNLGIMYSAFSGEFSEPFKTLNWLGPGAFGVLGSLAPQLSAKGQGLGEFADSTNKLIWKYQCQSFAVYGALAYTLLAGSGSAVEAVRNMMVMWALWIFDLRFIRASMNSAMKVELANVWTAFVFGVTALMFANESSPGSKPVG